jgi:hypothetical protein
MKYIVDIEELKDKLETIIVKNYKEMKNRPTAKELIGFTNIINQTLEFIKEGEKYAD